VQEVLKTYQRTINPNANVARARTIDEHGRSRGLGRRKASTARVWLVEGEGEVLINGKPITKAFDKPHDRESAIWALKATQRVDKYNVWALVSGGGMTGQAEALTLGVARALLVHEPALKPVLRRGESRESSIRSLFIRSV
jgi:small subunit ribosomal protein S9